MNSSNLRDCPRRPRMPDFGSLIAGIILAVGVICGLIMMLDGQDYHRARGVMVASILLAGFVALILHPPFP